MPVFVALSTAPYAWSYWFPDLLPQLKDCPNILVEHELRRAAQDFFKRTRSWQVIQPLLAIAAEESVITVELDDAQQELVRIESVWFDGERLIVKTNAQMDDDFSDDWRLHTGTPKAYVQLTPGVLALYPVPTAASVTGLKLLVSVRPSEIASGLPEDVATLFREEILAGAKARLLMQADKPWTNLQLAGVAASAFDTYVSRANLAAAHGFGRGRIAARPSWC